MRKTVEIDCAGVKSTDEFWQRYVDATRPEGAAYFGRNLDAFWDAVEHGGPGWPGNVNLAFVNSDALASFMNGAGTTPLLEALRQIATEATQMKIEFI